MKRIFKISLIFLIPIIIFLFIIIIKDKINSHRYPWHIYETNIYKVWNEGIYGLNVTVAFVDTGLNKQLQDSFGDRIINPYNEINQTTNVEDKNGHGTEITCIVACSYEKNGIYGIAPDVKIMPIVVMDQYGRTSANYLAQGILYAVDNGADIINISLGSEIKNDLVTDAIKYAFEKGVILVAAAGDYEEEHLLFPASDERVIGIEAQSKLGGRYLYSNYSKDRVIVNNNGIIDI